MENDDRNTNQVLKDLFLKFNFYQANVSWFGFSLIDFIEDLGFRWVAHIYLFEVFPYLFIYAILTFSIRIAHSTISGRAHACNIKNK